MRKTLIAVISMALACGGATEPLPLQVPGAVPFADTQLLNAIWVGLDHCTGETKNMADVEFYTVSDEWIVVGGVQYWGYWFREGNRVFLTDRVKTSATALEHEMMHARLQTSEHPAFWFNGVCGNLIVAVAGQG